MADTSKTETYTVTKHAGPKVAGRVVAHGDEIELTEAEARSEELAGAIVKGGKADVGDKDPLAGSKKLAAIQQKAEGDPPGDPDPKANDPKANDPKANDPKGNDPAAGGEKPKAGKASAKS